MGIITRCVNRLVPELKPIRDALLQTGYSARAIRDNLTSLRIQLLLGSERGRDPKRLLSHCQRSLHGFKSYSQNHEDGIMRFRPQNPAPQSLSAREALGFDLSRLSAKTGSRSSIMATRSELRREFTAYLERT